MQEALNKQLNAELYSSYLYLSMSAYFLSLNLAGFASWMRVQTQEEQVEEEASADDIVKKLGLVGDAKNLLYLLDQELGQRPPVFTLPTAAAAE